MTENRSQYVMTRIPPCVPATAHRQYVPATAVLLSTAVTVRCVPATAVLLSTAVTVQCVSAMAELRITEVAALRVPATLHIVPDLARTTTIATTTIVRHVLMVDIGDRHP